MTRRDQEDEDYIDVNRVREALGDRPSIFDNAAFDPATYDPLNTDPSYDCAIRASYCERVWAEAEDMRRALALADDTVRTVSGQRDEAYGEIAQARDDKLRLDGSRIDAECAAVRLRDSLRDVLSLIADEDSGDGKGELIRDTSRDDAPDYLLRMMRLVKILATATALAGETHAAPSTVGRAGSDAVARDPQGDSGPMAEA